jgi:thaumarchaeosortase
LASDKAVQAAGSPTIFGINTSIAVTLALIAPIIFTLIRYPDDVSLSWNEGRGGFIFAMAFIAAELIGIKTGVSKKNSSLSWRLLH